MWSYTAVILDTNKNDQSSQKIVEFYVMKQFAFNSCRNFRLNDIKSDAFNLSSPE